MTTRKWLKWTLILAVLLAVFRYGIDVTVGDGVSWNAQASVTMPWSPSTFAGWWDVTITTKKTYVLHVDNHGQFIWFEPRPDTR